MPSDIKAHGWTRLFHTQLDLSLPEELTVAWWKKKKQTIAKMTHATGMEAALTKLVGDMRDFTMAHCEFNPSVHLVEQNQKDCAAFMTSAALKTFQKQLQDIKKLATDGAAALKKSPLTKKTADYLLEIKDMADKVGVCLSPGSLSDCLKSAMQEWHDGQKQKAKSVLFPAALSSSNTTRGKLPKTLGEIREKVASLKDIGKDQLPAKITEMKLATEYHTLCRDLTTPLGNLLKGYDAGVAVTHFDEPKIRKLYRDISIIANAQDDGASLKELDYAKWQQYLTQIDKWAGDFVTLTKDIAAA